MNIFDLEIIRYLNQFSQHSWAFDKSIVFLSGNSLLKGGILTIIIWWLWFKREDEQSSYREHIISTLFGCIIAIVLARTLALTLPFRLRPLHEDDVHFLLPYEMPPNMLDGWSSFPSDHAVLFFSLSTGLLFVLKEAGIFALIYSTFLISFPRLYLGLHYPTDIIAGAVVGISIALLANIYLIKNKKIQLIVNLSYSKPNLFYPLFFLFTYQIAEMFNSSRALASGMFKLLEIIFV